jgi:crotonobetainyl-CoA:carnitine CoA-transferase CaiB-like acyl-CoA transferase
MGVFKTQDGYITIAASRPMWRKFCGALGAPELTTRPEYDTADRRVKNREALNADIERVTHTKASAEWIEIMNKAGVPCGPIYTLETQRPQVQHLGIAQTVESAMLGPTTIIGQAFRQAGPRLERRARMWRRYRRHPAGAGLRSGDDCGAARASGHLAGRAIAVLLPRQAGERGIRTS